MGLTEIQKLVVKGIGSCTGDESMLNDEHILEFKNILKNFSSFNIQSSLLVQKPYNIISISIDCEYIQLLFLGNSKKDHWICMYYSNNIIHIYDSLNVKCLKDEDKVFIVRPDFLFMKIRHVYFVGEPRSLCIYRPRPIDGNLLCCVLLCAACPYAPHARSSFLKEGGKVENQRQNVNSK